MLDMLGMAALVIDTVAIIFAIVYLWLNSFSKYTDIDRRNLSILTILKVSVVMILVFPILTCLFTKSTAVEKVMNVASQQYMYVAFSWLILILIIGITMFIALVRKAPYRTDYAKAIKKVLVIALWAFCISGVLAWLLS
ncbi:MAG: hypothetical protein MJ166_03780 [Clostridia bacterium]|nr:hypothetical protein [Clostridia bacterium]